MFLNASPKVTSFCMAATSAASNMSTNCWPTVELPLAFGLPFLSVVTCRLIAHTVAAWVPS